MAVRIANLGQFLGGLDRQKRRTDELVGLATRRISLGVLSRLVLASPVDTGRFRGNWQVEIGHDPTAALDTVDKSGKGTVAKGSAVIAGAPPFRLVIIANNLSYGPKLNDGHSKQAPAGFVEAAIDADDADDAEMSPFL